MNYDPIASEYYDKRHITSRNFDKATLAFLRTWRNPLPTEGLVLDLGCGCGRANYYLGIASHRILQCDISKCMLNLTPREACKEIIQSDASSLDFPNDSFVAVVAFLFDTFNEASTYREISRVLSSGGVFLGTLPHHTWGKLLREIRGYKEDKAKFLMKDGTIFEADSFLMDDEQITRSLKEANLEQLDSFDLHLPKSEKEVSPDILAPARAINISPYDLPIVKLFVAKKK
jgi:ubiquinone/menaquinone biosynthesis C-methylase UbiE